MALREPVAGEQHPRIRHIERLAQLLDAQFRVPILGYKIGLDGLLGLVPVVGDVASGLMALYLIYQAYTLGMRNRRILEMIGNAVVDFLVGLIPILGDFLDFVNKSNAKNAAIILTEHKAGRLRETRG